MKGIKDHFGELLVISFIFIIIIHFALWNFMSKNISEELIKERLIGTTFTEKNDEDNCIIVTKENIQFLEYTVKPKFDLAIGKPGGNHVCEIDFSLGSKSGNGEDYIVNGTLVLRYNKDDGRTWVCERLYTDGYYSTDHVNWYTIN